jgi:hypothetical protein
VAHSDLLKFGVCGEFLRLIMVLYGFWCGGTMSCVSCSE